MPPQAALCGWDKWTVTPIRKVSTGAVAAGATERFVCRTNGPSPGTAEYDDNFGDWVCRNVAFVGGNTVAYGSRNIDFLESSDTEPVWGTSVDYPVVTGGGAYGVCRAQYSGAWWAGWYPLGAAGASCSFYPLTANSVTTTIFERLGCAQAAPPAPPPQPPPSPPPPRPPVPACELGAVWADNTYSGPLSKVSGDSSGGGHPYVCRFKTSWTGSLPPDYQYHHLTGRTVNMGVLFCMMTDPVDVDMMYMAGNGNFEYLMSGSAAVWGPTVSDPLTTGSGTAGVCRATVNGQMVPGWYTTQAAPGSTYACVVFDSDTFQTVAATDGFEKLDCPASGT
jgi:hypothetical protein